MGCNPCMMKFLQLMKDFTVMAWINTERHIRDPMVYNVGKVLLQKVTIPVPIVSTLTFANAVFTLSPSVQLLAVPEVVHVPPKISTG